MSDVPEITPQPQAGLEVDQAKLDALVERMHGEQNLLLGLAAGIVAMLVGAALWAVVTAVTHWQIGYMAVGVGLLVGYAVRAAGKGMTTVYGVMGAVLSLLGCVLGNLLSVCIIVASDMAIPFADVVAKLTPALAVDMMVETFHPLDLLFYAFAVMEGYRFSIRGVTEDQLRLCLRPAAQAPPAQ